MSSDLEIRCVVVGMLEANCYLVKCDTVGHGIVIDPGDDPENISMEIRAMRLEPEAILLTHGHIDHSNAAATLRRRFRCRVVCHRWESKTLTREDGATLWGLEKNPCDVDHVVTDGDILEVGDKTIRVIHTPGHTKGSVCYMIDSVLFSGDALFKCSIGRTDLPGGSDREMMDSLNTKIATLDDSTIVYPGHGPSTTIEYEKRCNPFLQLR